MKQGLHLSDLDTETKARLGLAPGFDQGAVPRKVVALGKVLLALRGLMPDEIDWVCDQSPAICDSASPSRTPITPIAWVIQTVATAFNIDKAQLSSRSRVAEIALSRQVCMYILCQTTDLTYTQIGQTLGGRCPATISYGYQKIAKEIDKDAYLNHLIGEVLQSISALKEEIVNE